MYIIKSVFVYSLKKLTGVETELSHVLTRSYKWNECIKNIGNSCNIKPGEEFSKILLTIKSLGSEFKSRWNTCVCGMFPRGVISLPYVPGLTRLEAKWTNLTNQPKYLLNMHCHMIAALPILSSVFGYLSLFVCVYTYVTQSYFVCNQVEICFVL